MFCFRRFQGSTLTKLLNRQYSSKYDNFVATNEPVLGYLKGSEERAALEKALQKYHNTVTEIPIVIGGKELQSDEIRYQVEPFDHQKKIAKYSVASESHIQQAIDASLKVRKSWEKQPLEKRADIFIKAAEIMKRRRQDLNATTMLGQGKTVVQAEIDAACELIDFLNFNVQFAMELGRYSPIDTKESTNTLRYRGMEGFIAAISPFNFTAIGGNLPTAPALMGNVVVWKPSNTSMLSNWTFFEILREAGLPDGVINFLPVPGSRFGKVITNSPHLGGINFTGSVPIFQWLWREVGNKIENFNCYPRLIGECGGKNYHLVHKSADLESVANGTIRAAFEYQGQKCSACSRMYVPRAQWPELRDKLISKQKEIKMGSPLDFENFMTAVIDENAFNDITSHIDLAKSSPDMEIVAGGGYDKSKGYFIEPTIIETRDPYDKIMKTELFGPVVSVYVYPDDQDLNDVIKIIKDTTQFALTGAIFCQDRPVLEEAMEGLKDTAGNFYINDKSTGSVVGQQPFGGAALSGTNDKAGGPHYLLRWASPQAIKETSVPLREWKYHYMEN